MEAKTRERKRDPHTCAGCGASFDVTYYDDRAESAPSLYDVRCPRCGKAKSVTIPTGAEKTLRLELDESEHEEGGSG